MSKFVESWKAKTHLAKIVFLLVILYGVSSITTLLIALRITDLIPGFHLVPEVLLSCAIISFVCAVLVGVYHLSTFLRNRKRASDRGASLSGERATA